MFTTEQFQAELLFRLEENLVGNFCLPLLELLRVLELLGIGAESSSNTFRQSLFQV